MLKMNMKILNELKQQIVSDIENKDEFIEEEYVNEMSIAAYPALLSHSGEAITNSEEKKGKIQLLFRRNEDTYKLDNMYVSLQNEYQNVNETYEISINKDARCVLHPIDKSEIKTDGILNTYFITNVGDNTSIKHQYTDIVDKLDAQSGITLNNFDKLSLNDKEEYTKINYLLNLLKELDIHIFKEDVNSYIVNEDWMSNSDIIYQVEEVKVDDTRFTEPTTVEFNNYTNTDNSVKKSKLTVLRDTFIRNCPDKYEFIDQIERDNVKKIFGFKTENQDVIRVYTNYMAFILFKYILDYDTKLLVLSVSGADDFELVPFYYTVSNDAISSFAKAEFNMFNYEEGTASMRVYDSMEHMIEDTLGDMRDKVNAFILKDLPEEVWQFDIIPPKANTLMGNVLSRLLSDEKLFLKLNSLNEDVDVTLNEAVNIADIRKKVMDKITKVYRHLDRTGENLRYQLEYWNSMPDGKFMEEMKKFLADDKANFTLEVLPNKNEPSLGDIKKALLAINVPENEYVYFPHLGGIRTKHKVPVGYVHIKRLQQILSKKNTYTLDISKRNAKTGQVTGDSKIARISDLETTALTAIGADAALKEFLGPRADDSKGKNKMYADIGNFGFVSQADIPSSLEDKQTINTISNYLTAAGLDNDLVTDTRVLELIKTLV